MIDMRQGWLSKLKPNDKVVVQGITDTIGIVNRITPSGIIIVDGRQYSQQGRQRGATYRAEILKPYSEEDAHRIKKQKQKFELAKKLNNTNFQALSLGKLIKIEEIIKNGN